LIDKIMERGVVRDLEELPIELRSVFGTAHEVDISWHIKMQAAFQKYTENAVSKTVNLPHNATIEEVKKAYLLAWETGCKGITVFRDGSKEVQVLNIGKGQEMTKDSGQELMVERPFRAVGATYRLLTPMGTAFITINEDEAGQPLELFINVGKAGSDVTAMAEALGRVISAALRSRGGLSSRDRAEEISPSAFGYRRPAGRLVSEREIRSLPDAVCGWLFLFIAALKLMVS